LKTIKENKYAFLVFVLFLAFGTFLITSFEKIELQLIINNFFNPVGDLFFEFFTRLAEPWFTIPLLIYLLVKNWRVFIYIGSVYGISAHISQIIKLKFVHGTPRPFGTIENPSYQWSSIDLPQINSFPSGHTTTGFCIFMGLASIFQNKKLGVNFMIIACLVGFSRTYLSYHFMEDVVVPGAIVGPLTSILMYLPLKKPLRLNG
jgi:membrane-associated phospholipid phosphatase